MTQEKVGMKRIYIEVTGIGKKVSEKSKENSGRVPRRAS